MRLWSINPSYLDSKGLVALWREALLAKKVLSKKTRGYKHHPQLDRFKRQRNSIAAINAYLTAVYNESHRRGYLFNRRKIGQPSTRRYIKVADKQVHFEIGHLKKKLWKRDRKKYFEIRNIRTPRPHPLFRIIKGEKEGWEKLSLAVKKKTNRHKR